MTRNQRLRRVALLCIHFTRNLAYYRAIERLVHEKNEGDFWITMEGNCLDTAVLEWCKLFGDYKGKHYWGKIVDNSESFKATLLSTLSITEDEWENTRLSLRSYRDAFVAHLDSKETMNIPLMTLPKEMVFFYHKHILGYEDGSGIYNRLDFDLEKYYDDVYRDATGYLPT